MKRIFLLTFSLALSAAYLELHDIHTAIAADSTNLLVNGNFDAGLSSWSIWTERGTLSATTSLGQARMQSSNHNGGLYQRFSTGGKGTVLDVEGFWASDPAVPRSQWAEVLVINGTRLPVNGQDVKAGDADVVLLYKNDTTTSPGGWSGALSSTSPVVRVGSFTASGDVATIVLKSGNTGTALTGTRFDDVQVRRRDLPPANRPPVAKATATPASGEAPLQVQLDASGSTDPDGDALSFSWTFGDGTQGSGARPIHLFSQAGSFLVRLVATDGRGGSAEATATVTVQAPTASDLLVNARFDNGLTGWTKWTERGSLGVSIVSGQLQLQGTSHNGGVFQTFPTGGAGTIVSIEGFWASAPTRPSSQWAEVLVINGGRTPLNGQDVKASDPDVVLLYKNDTWTSPSGWSGAMSSTAPKALQRSFTAGSDIATLVLKSGNVGNGNTGTRFDDLVVTTNAPTPPPTGNGAPTASVAATPTSGTAPLSVELDGRDSSDPDGDPLTYSWDFGDGRSGTGPVTTHLYSAAGTYRATLSVDDGKGGLAAASVSITVAADEPPTGPNLVRNPGFEGNFSSGVGEGWQSWKTVGTGYWKPPSRIGRIGSGSYASSGQVLAAVKRLNPKVILLEGNALGMATELRKTFPDALMVGRLYIDPVTPQYLSDPERHGRKHAEDCIATGRSEVDIWQGLNEPYVNSVDSARKVARFEKAFSDRLQELGKKSVVLNLAVGNPGDMNMMLLPEIVDLLSTADYAGYHAYGGIQDQLLIGPQSPWYANRWRFYWDLYQERGLRMPPVLYTETNTFYQWKAGHTKPGYEPFEPWQIRDDLIAFAKDSRSDPWAVGMAIFLFGSSSAEFEGRETANEPVIYEGAGDHNWNHPADAKAGVAAQQFGANQEVFEGGIVQRATVSPGVEYRLTSSMKYETKRPRSLISFRIGYDPTGQTTNGSASSIVWTSDLIEAESRETDMWYEESVRFTVPTSAVSIWFAGTQSVGSVPFRITVDEVALERIQP